MRRLLLLVLLSLYLSPATYLYAQTQLDPSFKPQEIYQPASATIILQLSNGTRLVAGNFIRAEGQPASGLVCYLPTGKIDAAFAANVADNTWIVKGLAEASGGKIMVALQGAATINGQQYESLIRLLPNGTLDTSFGPYPFKPYPFNSASPNSLLVQPDDKVVLTITGSISYNGRTIGGVIRLNADGTVDQPFADNLGNGFQGYTTTSKSGNYTTIPVLQDVVRQPDGKLIIGGSLFGQFNGQVRSGMVRLNTDGSLDGSLITDRTQVNSIALQSDGKIVVTDSNGNKPSSALVRLNTNGSLDPSFNAPSISFIYSSSSKHLVQVQPDGRILVVLGYKGNTMAHQIVRLLPDGSDDPTWAIPFYEGDRAVNPPSSMQLLPNGQVLVAGDLWRYESAVALSAGVALLNTDGSYDASFAPQLRRVGSVDDMVVQPDGRIIIVGNFSEVDGTPARHIARLNADGTPDAVFGANCPIVNFNGYFNPYCVALQSDSKIIVGGMFWQVGGQPRADLVRLLPNGQVDNSFITSLLPNKGCVSHVALQADGKLVVTGLLQYSGSTYSKNIVRLTVGGQVDQTFKSAVNGLVNGPILVEPNGNIVLAGMVGDLPMSTYSLWRLLSSGDLDPTFKVKRIFPYAMDGMRGIARYPDGRLLVYGSTPGSGLPQPSVIRYLSNGTRDSTFTSPLFLAVPTWQDYFVAIQPNERILITNSTLADSPALKRILPDGTVDASLLVKPNGIITKIVLAPDGAIFIAGLFSKVGSTNCPTLIRLLDPNVLAISAHQSTARTDAWPNPTHETLQLSLDAAAKPQQITLVDALGKTVLTQPVTKTELSLPVQNLPAGVYLLRVDYTDGPTTRRIIIQ